MIERENLKPIVWLIKLKTKNNSNYIRKTAVNLTAQQIFDSYFIAVLFFHVLVAILSYFPHQLCSCVQITATLKEMINLNLTAAQNSNCMHHIQHQNSSRNFPLRSFSTSFSNVFKLIFSLPMTNSFNVMIDIEGQTY